MVKAVVPGMISHHVTYVSLWASHIYTLKNQEYNLSLVESFSYICCSKWDYDYIQDLQLKSNRFLLKVPKKMAIILHNLI